MKGNRSRDTKPELKLRRALREAGFGGYRLDWKKAAGRPDIAYPGKRIAVFVHGCYWHRCPICDPHFPNSNVDFWQRKFTRNKERDTRKKHELEADGWRVVEVWECQIKNDLLNSVGLIRDALKSG